MEPHVDFFRQIFTGQAFLEGKQPRTAPVGGFVLQKKPRPLGSYPTYSPLRLQSGVAWGVILHQEPSGGAVPAIHRKKAGEAGELVVGAL